MVATRLTRNRSVDQKSWLNVKMVHNGIEYGMMQSIAESFDLLRHSSEFDFDLKKITEIYSNGGVITSRLVSWLSDGYAKYGDL